MIWMFILGLSIAAFAYVAMPFYFSDHLSEDAINAQKNEVTAYRDELLNIEKKLTSRDEDITALSAQKLALEKRLIKSATQLDSLTHTLNPTWLIGILAILITGTFGIYILLGSPQLTLEQNLKPAILSASQALSQNDADVQHENNASMEDLISGLEKKLLAGSQNPQQWGLYARSLMTLNRFEDAFAAYERTLLLTNNNPDIQAELESARAFAAQQNTPPPTQNGPNQADMEAAAQMDQNDRAAMIQGMVDGLSKRLQESPNDPNGWIRLLRARKVLGQIEIAEKELRILKKQFANDPKTISDILQKSGWSD